MRNKIRIVELQKKIILFYLEIVEIYRNFVYVHNIFIFIATQSTCKKSPY
jgi:hypothetical protein